MAQFLLQVLLFYILYIVKDIHSWQCIDHDNNAVDWFVIYKLPLEKHENNLISEGTAYTYMTSVDDNWKLSDISINDTKSLVGLNLQPLFNKSGDNFYILYNDQHPDGSINFKKGHTKGVILGNNNGGIWLIHSVPHFPAINEHYNYPHSGLQYGQSFLCISFDLNNLNSVGMAFQLKTIAPLLSMTKSKTPGVKYNIIMYCCTLLKFGTQLQYNFPSIYSQNMPSTLVSALPNLVKVMNDAVITTPPWYRLSMLKSKGGSMFFSFAKTSKFAKELYADWIAPSLNISLLVETWPNGPGRLPSSCEQLFNVFNIESVSLKVANITFKTTMDHSKWAVVTKDNLLSKWVCIGDINRAQPQRQRAGGTVCFTSDKLVKTYQNSVASMEPCHK